jgi:hypothetical protein
MPFIDRLMSTDGVELWLQMRVFMCRLQVKVLSSEETVRVMRSQDSQPKELRLLICRTCMTLEIDEHEGGPEMF